MMILDIKFCLQTFMRKPWTDEIRALQKYIFSIQFYYEQIRS